MNWYVTKLVYQIICGEGNHAAQFDEQLRLIYATDITEALQKAEKMGYLEEDVFCNEKHEQVQWKFINVCELYQLNKLVDGVEIYSRIMEADDADSYLHFVRQKAASIREKDTHQTLQLI